MDEDEEVIRKGSALYHYLLENGFTNFESYEPEEKDTQWFQPLKECPESVPYCLPAPQWTVDRLNCILNCGLILEDHRHFIERFRPVDIQKPSNIVSRPLLCFGSILCLCGGLWGINRFSSNNALSVGAAGVSSFFVVFFIKQLLRNRSNVKDLSSLRSMLTGLEKAFIQYKRLLLLVHQNDLISQSLSGHQRESFELKKKLKSSLLSTIQMLYQFLEKVKEIPLAIDVDPALKSLTHDDISSISNVDDSDLISQEVLKRLFNSYILVQSEFLRRLALCFCSDIWNELTCRTLSSFSRKHLSDVSKWSARLYLSLYQEQKFFRAIKESKDKQSHLRLPVSSSWDFSDIYVSIRSASVHFHSLLMRIQHLQDILESDDCAHTKAKEDLLSSISQILIDINREISSGQACIDRSLVQALKTLNYLNPTAKLSEPESVPSTDGDLEKYSDSVFNPPVEDEVFELIISEDEAGPGSDEEDCHEASEYKLKKKREMETSKRVLLELKSVLIKKAHEWREREKRAMALKGIAYTAPEQVSSHVEEQTDIENDVAFSKEEDLDFVPPNCPNEWPLPRLKGSLKAHRSQKGQAGNLKHIPTKRLCRSPLQQSDIRRAREEEQRNSAQEMGTPKMGFGASLLAEAMAKSKAIQAARKEDVYLCSEDELSSGE